MRCPPSSAAPVDARTPQASLVLRLLQQGTLHGWQRDTPQSDASLLTTTCCFITCPVCMHGVNHWREDNTGAVRARQRHRGSRNRQQPAVPACVSAVAVAPVDGTLPVQPGARHTPAPIPVAAPRRPLRARAGAQRPAAGRSSALLVAEFTDNSRSWLLVRCRGKHAAVCQAPGWRVWAMQGVFVAPKR